MAFQNWDQFKTKWNPNNGFKNIILKNYFFIFFYVNQLWLQNWFQNSLTCMLQGSQKNWGGYSQLNIHCFIFNSFFFFFLITYFFHRYRNTVWWGFTQNIFSFHLKTKRTTKWSIWIDKWAWLRFALAGAHCIWKSHPSFCHPKK